MIVLHGKKGVVNWIRNMMLCEQECPIIQSQQLHIASKARTCGIM